jgi:hypothetical protein
MDDESVENILRIENYENLFVRYRIIPQDLLCTLGKGPESITVTILLFLFFYILVTKEKESFKNLKIACFCIVAKR